MTRTIAILVAAFVLVGFVGACSGDDDGGSIITSLGTSDETTVTTEDGGGTGDETIVTLGDDGAAPDVDAGADEAPTVEELPTTPPVAIATPTVTVQLADTAFTNQSKVTTAGIDEIIFGTEAQVAAEAASTAWIGVPEGTWPECFIVLPANGPEGIQFWVWANNIERLDVTQPALRTRSGYGVGTQLAQLQQELGDLITVEDRGDGTQVATFTPSDPGDSYRIVWEIVDGQATTMSSGRASLIGRNIASCGDVPDPSLVPDVPVTSACPTLGVLREVTANVPTVVQAKALAIQQAARDCDVEALAALTNDSFSASFGGGTFTEVYGNNGDAMAQLARMLSFPAAVDGAGTYVWPQATTVAWDQATDEMRDELIALGYGGDDFESFAANGYLGYRAGITAEGDWIFFVAGD